MNKLRSGKNWHYYDLDKFWEELDNNDGNNWTNNEENTVEVIQDF